MTTDVEYTRYLSDQDQGDASLLARLTTACAECGEPCDASPCRLCSAIDRSDAAHERIAALEAQVADLNHAVGILGGAVITACQIAKEGGGANSRLNRMHAHLSIALVRIGNE